MVKKKIDNFSYELKPQDKIIGIITHSKEDYNFILKPSSLSSKILNSLRGGKNGKRES